MRHPLKLLFNDDYRRRMDCAARLRENRRNRDQARAAGDETGAGFWQFSAQVTRNSRLVCFTRTTNYEL